MHVFALVAIWTYVYAYSKAGGDVKAIWPCVYACLSAGEHMDLRFCSLSARGHMDLRLCISQRRRSYGPMCMHMGASRVIWQMQMWLW